MITPPPNVLVIAEALNIGCLSMADVLFAVPLTLAANALPLTPNAIGVGETAFDQICRWMESEPSGGAYSSIFFAFQTVSMLASLVRTRSFLQYRKRRRNPAS